MIKTDILLWESKDDVIYYVEIERFIEGKPIYYVKKGWYLRSYIIQHNAHEKIINFITASDSITTTVVRHVPNSRTFMTEEEALIYILKLNKGEVEYERY